jgi:hypothetical protein
MHLHGCAGFSCPFLKACIWVDKISQWMQERECITFSANLEKSVMETLAMIRQAFDEENMRYT